MHATRHRLASLVYWKGLSKYVKQSVRECDACQRCKYDYSASPGLLQPLPISQRPWAVMSTDFIEGLPNSRGKDTILVVIDRLTKYGHFVALSHPFTAMLIAQEYLNGIYRLLGAPETLVSYRDSFCQLILARVIQKAD